MKILAIIGSPRRKGNTYRAVQEIEAQLKTLGEVEVEYLWLADANIQPCRGCFACLSYGEQRCALKDDRDPIIARMAAADGLILAAPTYCNNMPGLMKSWIDRNAYLFHRPALFRQAALVVVTSAGGGIPETIKEISNLRFWGLRYISSLGLITPLYPPRSHVAAQRAQKVTKAAASFWAALNDTRPPKVNLFDLVHFQAIRGNAKFAPKYFPADLAYYREKDLMEANYYVPARISPLTKALAGLAIKLVGRSFERDFDGSA
jgi:NAD(P)H-dependent FMN reductase